MAAASRGGESFTTRMGGVQGMLTKVGKATTVVGLAFVAYGVKAAGDFQQQMNLLVTACGESQSKLKMVSDGVMSLARQTGTSTGQLAEGMYQVEKAGYRAGDGLQVLKAAAQGAREEGADLKDVTNAMTSVMASYHLKATDSVRVMNAIKTAAGEGKMTMQEFAASLATVIPIASANSVSFAEVGGAIATLSQHGTSAREATQELASTIRNLAAPNNVAVQEMQRLGLSSTDVATRLGKRGLTGTLDLLSQTVLAKMGPSGTLLLDSFNKTKQASENLRTMLTSMPEPVRTLATDLQSGAMNVGAYGKALKALPADQAAMGAQFKTLLQKSEGFNAELKRGGPAAQTYTEAIKKMTGGAIGLNTTLQLTGENTHGFKERVGKVAESFDHASKNVEGWELTQASFNVQMGRLKEVVTTSAIVIGTKLIPVILKVITFFEKNRVAAYTLAIVVGGILLAGMAAFTASLYAMAAAAAVNPVTWIVLGVIALIAVLVLLVVKWSTVWNWIKSVSESVGHAVVGAWNWVKNGTMSAWNGVLNWLKSVWHSISTFFTSAWHSAVDPIVAGWNWVANVTSTVWGAISAFFKKWWPLLLVIFLPAVAVIMAIWNRFHTQIIGGLVRAWNWILGYLSATWEDIRAGAMFAWGLVKKAIINPITDTWNIIKVIWRLVSDWLADRWAIIRAAARVAWEKIRTSMIDPMMNVLRTIRNVVNMISDAIGNGLRSAWNSVRDVGSWFWGIGSAIVHGIINGVTGSAGSLYSSLRNLANSALSSAKDFLGIRSPSRVFAEVVGAPIAQGVAKGIDAHAGTAVSSVRSMSGLLASQRVGIPSVGFTGVSAAGMGGGGGSHITNINITVQGSVSTIDGIAREIEESFLRRGMRNPSTYPAYSRS
ncbi:phage tail tape measure protein [Streptomyces sp. H27-G5]|uniref:phage tail tape measure protein n=1 Tax=Streptomyces sp. H27-G5 TaxID=2996698 RepID=UPI002272136B|nr:phage tail tape measure protein [Streptomyces sp. H27-G5]MCY0917062.1 phage tail tape measure protein [Streptomyces sp. H27-G5]